MSMFVSCKRCPKVSYVSGVNSVSHDLHPALEGSNLEEWQVGPAHVVKLHVWVDPDSVVLLEAGVNIGHNLVVNREPSRDVKALVTLNRW